MGESNTIEINGDVNREMALMTDVASQVQLVSVDFIQFFARKCKEPDGRPLKVNLSSSAASSAVVENNTVTVVVDAVMLANYEEEESPTVEVRAVIRLVYECEGVERFDKEHIDAFGKINGVYNAWPYWREYVQSAVGRLGMPPLILPSLKIA